MAESERCIHCGNVLTKDDIGLTKKMINRGAEEFFCIACLAAHFELAEDVLREKIREFKAMGGTLFDQE